MTEFKINRDLLEGQVTRLHGCSNEINSDYQAIPSDEVSKLQTAMQIIEQQEEIKKLIVCYQELVDQECQNLTKVIKETVEMDQAISDRLNP